MPEKALNVNSPCIFPGYSHFLSRNHRSDHLYRDAASTRSVGRANPAEVCGPAAAAPALCSRLTLGRRGGTTTYASLRPVPKGRRRPDPRLARPGTEPFVTTPASPSAGLRIDSYLPPHFSRRTTQGSCAGAPAPGQPLDRTPSARTLHWFLPVPSKSLQLDDRELLALP